MFCGRCIGGEHHLTPPGYLPLLLEALLPGYDERVLRTRGLRHHAPGLESRCMRIHWRCLRRGRQVRVGRSFAMCGQFDRHRPAGGLLVDVGEFAQVGIYVVAAEFVRVVEQDALNRGGENIDGTGATDMLMLAADAAIGVDDILAAAGKINQFPRHGRRWIG
jgi:hypothetical protein